VHAKCDAFNTRYNAKSQNFHELYWQLGINEWNEVPVVGERSPGKVADSYLER